MLTWLVKVRDDTYIGAIREEGLEQSEGRGSIEFMS